MQELERAAAEGAGCACAVSISRFIHHKQRVRIVLLGFDVDRFVVILRVDDDRQIELLRIGPREAGVAVGAPLHRRADAVAVAEIDVVPHADLVAVVEHRRARQREQQAVHQLDAAAVVAQQRRQPAANAQVDARLRIARRRRGTCSRALRRSPSPASARRDCAGTWPTGSCRESPASAPGCRRSGKRSSMCIAMNSRGITGKWNAMWHSSPSPK